MLELNTNNNTTFVVEMMKANLLIPLVEPVNSTSMFTTGLNEFDLIKLKLPSKEEFKGIVEGNSEMYNDRIEDRLSCKVLIFKKKQLTMDAFQFPNHLNVHISFILNV